MSIIIIGAGMTGAVLALTISKMSNGMLPITIIEEKKLKNHHHTGYDARTIVLSDGTIRELKRINLWSIFQTFATKINYIHISEANNINFLLLQAKDYDIDALGHVIQVKKIGQCLFDLLKKEKNITFHCPSVVTHVYRNLKKVMVVLNNKKKIFGKLIIAANGPNSDPAKLCGIRWKKEDYKQIAVIGNIITQFSSNNYAFEHFTSYGPIAILPISDNVCSFICCFPTKMHMQIKNWNNNNFLKYLQNIFSWKLGKILHVEQFHVYPLSLETANEIINHRIVVVGNTAQTLHPVAGQGYNLAIRDIILLSTLVVKNYNLKKDFGHHSILKTYKNLRALDRKSIIFITDILIKLFSNTCIPLKIIRMFGFKIINRYPEIRNIFIKRMLGWIKY